MGFPSIHPIREGAELSLWCAEGGAFQENTWIVRCEATRAWGLVDPGAATPDVIRWAEAEGLPAPDAIWLTHAHLDHVEGIPAARARWPELPIFLHPEDRGFYDGAPAQAAHFGLPFTGGALPAPTHALSAGDTLSLGALSFTVRHAPGHAPGHVIFLLDAAQGPPFALVGDVVFLGSIGRTDLPMGDFETLIASIRREVLSLPDEVVLCPGHGPTTTVGFERVGNPFLAPQFGGPPRGFA
jgi:hydroxyacylglutathione hydrolase